MLFKPYLLAYFILLLSSKFAFSAHETKYPYGLTKMGRLNISEQALISSLWEMFDDHEIQAGLSNCSPFSSKHLPYISYMKYAQGFKKHAIASLEEFEDTLVTAAKYIKEYIKKSKQSSCKITKLDFHRLFAVSLRIANKFLDDDHISNLGWAQIAGISLYELNDLEKIFLIELDFNLWVDKEILDRQKESMLELYYKKHFRT